MIDKNRVFQPLDEAEGAIAKLQDYESTAELAAALQATRAAVQKSLRYLLRADKSAPDDLRLTALSAADMTPERLIPALRQRDLISLDLAGQIHELDQAAKRAEQGAVRAKDGDLALRVVDQLRTEVRGHTERNMRVVAHNTVESGALDDVHAVPAETESRKPTRLLAALALALALALLAFLILRPSGTEKGVKQFNAKQYSQSERTLRSAFDGDPGDAVAAYYLAILYRRSRRFEEAGAVLRRAIEKSPRDPYLREELGNLFTALNQPQLAVKQYRAAQESDPANPRYWVKLVNAMRAAGDPEAESVLQRAPAEARAMVQTGR